MGSGFVGKTLMLYVHAPSLLAIVVRGKTIRSTFWAFLLQLEGLAARFNFPFTGTVAFNTGLSVTSFSQFSIGADPSVVLPVQLLSFTATNVNNTSALLNWNTAQEINLKGYSVERSADGINFSAIGYVNATGQSSYSFEDKAPLPGNDYYRLKMEDQDGKSTYSAIRNLKFTSGVFLTISPNPTKTGTVNLAFTGLQPNIDLVMSVTNSLGALVHTTSLKDIQNGSRLAASLGTDVPGAYFVRITLSTGQVLSEKVIFSK